MSEKIKDIYVIDNYPNGSNQFAHCMVHVETCSTKEINQLIKDTDHTIEDFLKYQYIICEITHTGLKLFDKMVGYNTLIVAENKMNRFNQKNGYTTDELTRVLFDTFRLKALKDTARLKKWSPVLAN